MINEHAVNVQGRFHLVADTQDAKIVGLMGNVHYNDLLPNQLNHIATFYALPGHCMEFLSEYPVLLNRSAYTGFIKIMK